MAPTKMRKTSPDLHSDMMEEMDATRLRSVRMTMTQDGEVTTKPRLDLEFTSKLMRGQQMNVCNP